MATENLHSPYRLQPEAFARAYLGSDQLNLVNATWTLVDLDTESYDPNSNFDVANHKYVTPLSAYYLIIGRVRFTSFTADKRASVGIHVDGSRVTLGEAWSTSTNVTAIVCDIVSIPVGKDVELYAKQDTGANNADLDAEHTSLVVRLLTV